MNSDETQNYGVSNGDDSSIYNTGGSAQWQQQDTTQRITRTTTTTTTTSSPYLIFEDSFNGQQPQYQSTSRTTRPTVRPATRTTRRTTTARTTSRTSSPSSLSSDSFWTGSSQRPLHTTGSTMVQHRPHNTGTTQQSQFSTRPSTTTNYDYNGDFQNTQQQQQQGNSQPSQFGLSNTQTQTQHQPQAQPQPQSQDNQFTQQDNQYRPQQQDNQYRPQQQGISSSSQFGTNNNNQNPQTTSTHSTGIPFSQPETPQFGLNQPTQQTFNQQGTSQSNRPHQNCRPSITTVNKKRIACKDTLIFEEQFDYNFPSRWSEDIRMPVEFEVNELNLLILVLC